MDIRHPVLCLFLILCLFVLSAGCASAPVQQSTTTPVSTTIHQTENTGGRIITTAAPSENLAEQLASVQSDNPIWREAYRMFRNIKSTEYVHPPYTADDATGVYRFDCLGFVDHVLMDADMASYKEIGKNVNPSIESYSAYFNKLDAKVPNALGWTKVTWPADLKPGDICLWLKPSTLDTGHMWIIAGEPKVNPKRTDEVMVRIFDSTGTVHSDDSRTGSSFKTGLGSGILGFMVDRNGNPVGLYWEGGISSGAGEKDTTIVCGRLNR
jgi:hypothetical protein